MRQVVKDALLAAIERKRLELQELENELRRVEREDREGRKPVRRRKQTGIKPGSIPSLALTALEAAGKPVGAAGLAEAISQHARQELTTRTLAAALKRYIDHHRYFRRTPEGLYELIRKQQ